ncbi:hypothetical protein K438DRAFT_1810942 [Mycena galopus ATCC 62051]|nr:hypothetical protein K438DRAFT_1810942 [Mycena galopus ATCC 62051]
MYIYSCLYFTTRDSITASSRSQAAQEDHPTEHSGARHGYGEKGVTYSGGDSAESGERGWPPKTTPTT